MSVRRQLLDGERDRLVATGLRQAEAISLMNGDSTSQVGQRERALPIATIRGADELKERLVLGDGQKLSPRWSG